MIEVRSYARFIKNWWGDLKPDELKRNDIDRHLKKLKVTNNTRRKYLHWVRMFFSWVKDEGHITQNPTDGIKFKPDDFNAACFTPEQTTKLLRYVVEHEKDLIGYYALLTFAGLRPSEGARVQWEDCTFKTNEHPMPLLYWLGLDIERGEKMDGQFSQNLLRAWTSMVASKTGIPAAIAPFNDDEGFWKAKNIRS